MWLRELPPGTPCEYLPVRSTVPYLPLAAPQGTIYTHVIVGDSPGLLRDYERVG
jgi:hypothetical protein